MSKSVRFALVLSVLLGLAAAAAEAGERLQITGSYTGLDRSQVIDLEKDHQFITIVSEALAYLVDPPNDHTPLQYAAGPCGGFAEVKDGVTSGRGYCIRTNPEGGKWLVSFEIAPDPEKGVTGTWQLTGVEGNTVGWKGGGTWNTSIQIGEGRYVLPFSGWLEKP
jgi:hypothetical protein